MTIIVDYRFPAAINAEKQAKTIAIGQTAGTWSERHSHRQKQLQQHLAEVVGIREEADGYKVARVRFPQINVENDIASLLTMIFGKYSMAGAGKVVGVYLPESYGTKAKLGITGIRQRLGVYDRPLVMAIFKPALGLSAQDHADILREVAFAGLDVIKDDEIMADLPVAPTHERLDCCRRVLEEVRQQTGRNVL